MRRFFAKILFGGLVLGVPLFAASTASAADCGWLGYGSSASLDCTLVTSGGCTTQCTPLTVTAQCGATCQGSCHADIDVSCTDTCETSCKTKCTPSELDCVGFCQEDCEGNCSSYCEKHGNSSDCVSQCQGSCEGDCGVNCQVKPGSCTTMCQEACKGSCHAQANLDCEVKCQGGCSADVEGGCKTACSAPEGALFCNGQYVEASDVVACETAFYVDVNASCDASGCEVDASTGCNTAKPGDAPTSFAAVGAMLAGLGLIVSRRRRSKKQ